ncbi:MAG: large subunit ribosomal protein L5 [archaeon GW2011_AR9]|nr:large subunit ribosomal protein L5 [uncultured archaeon]KHO50236.1 MAG: large subunit ribosomal protein L5 [archaeon GW2011_AR9]MBS3120274.1 50S ribosomal protein L5 [Candidatus Woesearchaeota archaeon]HIG92971.1 50S ribosomal protein L5 [Candidatus Woesearchaeota archaeon]HIH12704.1 50S ribosomal protein L5 [Candidatus Woesearchaeota archaeon]
MRSATTNQPGTKKDSASSNQNPMRDIIIRKVTLNIGAGKNEDLLKKGLKLFQKLSPLAPVKTVTKKRIPEWGLRPGLQIGCMVTVREGAEKLLQRLLAAKEKTLSAKNFDTMGNFSFGIPEYIDIEGLEYDPDLKIIGLEVAVTLERPGYRVKRRRINTRSVGKKHQVTKEEAIAFVQSKGIKVI